MTRKQINLEESEHMDVDNDTEEDEEEEGGVRIGDIYIAPPPPPACTFDSTGPRLIITHIENFNFKSYAGKQVLGPFHKSFTSIVGPNGSGKSNVIDSMLFVFGYRAQRIRSKKISVLIHNSENHSDIDSCCVKVHFQEIIDKPEDGFEVVPNSQFVVSRTAYKDNSSWYAINEKRVPFKQIGLLLRSHGIDLDHNRFLILQGEVEQIAMMKPKGQTEYDTGMLEFLEDIIGCSRFKKPIEILSQRVEELNEQRAEKLNRVKAVEKEKDELEGAKNEAVDYLKLENEITSKKNILFQRYKYESEQQEQEAVKKRDEILEGMKEVNDALEELKKQTEAKEKECKKVKSTFEQKAKTVEEKKEEYSALEREDLHCRESLKHAKSKAKRLIKMLETEKEKLEQLKPQPKKLEEEVENLKRKKEKLEGDKQQEEEKLAKIMASLNKETQGLQEEKEKFETELMELQKAVNETKSKMDIAQAELDLYLSTEKTEKTKLQEITKNREKTIKLLKERQSSLKELESRIPACEKALHAVETELHHVMAEEARMSAEYKLKRMKVEESKSAMQASKSKGRVLQALMQEKERGILPGIFGRLGDLGGINEKYDVAISTACGPLDNIVTDSLTTAQKCVEFLKKNNIGVATFIALDKMERWIPYTKQKIQTPENVPRLFDLIEVKDTRVLPAFYYALRDTLVANNLEQATRIGLQGKKRHRVVTLKGELIDLSGTMSGGGGKAVSGRMGTAAVSSDITSDELTAMITKLEELRKITEDLKERKMILEEKMEQLNKELVALRHSEQKHRLEVEAFSTQEHSLTQQEKQQQEHVKNSAPDKNQMKKLEKVVVEATSAYKKSANAASVVEKKVQKIHNQILEITEGKMGESQKKVDSLSNQIDGVSSAITKTNVAVKTAIRNIKKGEEKVTSLEKETVENTNDLENLKKELENLEVKAQNIMDDLDASDKEKEKLEKELKIILQEISVIKEKENKLNSDHIEVKNELDKCTVKIRDNANKIKHWESQLAKLTLQELDGETNEPLTKLPPEDLEKVDTEACQYEITVLEERLQNMKPNMAAIAEYKKKEALYLERVAELDSVTELRDTQRRHHDDLRKQRLNDFMTGFSIITTKLKEMYQMITLGGDAELELVDSLDPFSEGIVFSVRPPKKSWKNISNLSGGEKTLSSLALVFALHYYKPTPLYVMDEIDAALDFKNVSIVAHYIKERTKNAQFIIISLRNNMFELADRLVGIYKTYNCTKSVTINPAEIGKPKTSEGTEKSASEKVTE
ncbi:structural maintenance of chromosomes 4-like protein gluon [Tachypleus tridentatus]|uniref:structural maintenance of chromosomes 4-like protein gluon n=1 Tax=Tachypleus tridentatus TaxID=6853 RepID=UPI003FD05E2B